MPAKPFVPLRWIVRTAWRVHRGIAARGPGRGLWLPGERHPWGALTLITVGRRSGEERRAIVGNLTEGETLHTLAMNGWGEGHPAWWLNLQADPRARVMLSDGSVRDVVAHRAVGEERDRLWAAWTAVEPHHIASADHRSTPTDVVVLDPVTVTAS